MSDSEESNGDNGICEYVLENCASSTWSKISDSCLKELEETDYDYRQTARLLNWSASVKSVFRVENPFLLGCYLLKKEEYRARGIYMSERTMFHCTASVSASSICENNLDWRRSVRTKYGQGVSFSPSPEYANTWANRGIGSSRAMIVARVLVGNTAGGDYGTVLPPVGCDTTTGNSCQVYVKYYDYEFYPEYVIKYVD